MAKLQKDWKKEPELAELKKDFDLVKSNHDTEVAKITKARNLKNIEGGAKLAKIAGRSNVQPKLIRKNNEWQYASLANPFLSTEDVFNAYPVSAEDVYAAEQNGLLLNYQFNNKLRKVKFINDLVHDCVDNGVVFARVGWKTVTSQIVENTPVFSYTVAQDYDMPYLEGLAKLQNEQPNEFMAYATEEDKESLNSTLRNNAPTIAKLERYDETPKEVLVHNHPEVTVVDYRNLYVGPCYNGDITTAEFVIYSYETSIADLRKDGKFTNLDSIENKSENILADNDHTPSKFYEDGSNFALKDDRQRIVAYEYWGNYDINDDGIFVAITATWVGSTLVHLDRNPFPDQLHPFVAACSNHITNSVYGEADAHVLEDNQAIVGAVTRGMIDLMGRSANAQTGVRADALDPVNLRKFNNGENYMYRPNVADPRSMMVTHTYPEIPAAAFNMIQYQQNEAESMSGVKAFNSSLSGNSLGDTATAVRGVLDATAKRESNIQMRIAECIIAIGKKIIAMNGEFLSETEVIRVTGSKFVTVRRDDLAGNFDLRLSISTAEADNAKAEELAFMLQTTGNTLDFSITQHILVEICKLRKMPSLAQKIEQYMPQPDPMAQRKAQLENLLLEAKIMEAQANAGVKASETDLNRQRAITEQAQALNMQADTDLKKLDYVEQESGTKHARDLATVGEQAKSNAKFKLMTEAYKRTLDSNPTHNGEGNGV